MGKSGNGGSEKGRGTAILGTSRAGSAETKVGSEEAQSILLRGDTEMEGQQITQGSVLKVGGWKGPGHR